MNPLPDGLVTPLCERLKNPYQIKELGFYWLIAELDREKDLAFGYANLNDHQMAEWGYISIRELLENGAELDRNWKPCT